MLSKFFVLKNDDIEKALEDLPYIGNYLDDLTYRIREIKEDEGRSVNNEYIVINTDEPYIDEVIAIMKKHGHWD